MKIFKQQGWAVLAAITLRGLLIAPLLAISLLVSTAHAQNLASVTATTKPGLAGCKPYYDTSKYTNHQYEVCTAYVANVADIALQGYYKYGNNRANYLSDAARHHFETRYWSGPRQTIERRVNAWPKTSSFAGNKVSQSITVLAVSSNLAADKGYVNTSESWKVISPQGKTLYNHSTRLSRATLCRAKLPGHILHEWFVVGFGHQTNLNCRAFDTSHGLIP